MFKRWLKRLMAQPSSRTARRAQRHLLPRPTLRVEFLEDRIVPNGSDFFSTAPFLQSLMPTSDPGSNVGATGEFGEPDNAAVSSPIQSVWWNWVAPATGT